MKEKVSIIVPIYNVEKYLNKCIESIVNQSYGNIEIILINDGSTDGSDSICNCWAERDKRIIYKYIENKGVSNARNLGIELATGEYISFIDSDDYIDKDMIKKMINKAITGNDDIVVSNLYYAYIGDKIIERKKWLNVDSQMRKNYIENICQANKFGGYSWNKLYKTKMIKENNVKFNINIKIMEDLIFNLELFPYINNIGVIDEPLYYYFQREGSALNSGKNFNNFKAYKIIIDILNKYNSEYTNDYKLKYIFEAEKVKILDKKADFLQADNYNQYYNYKLFFGHGDFKIKLKILILKIIPWIYKLK